MFRRSSVRKVLCSENICSKGSMFRRFYIQKVLYSENPLFYVGTNLHLSVSGKLQCKEKNHSLFLILAQMSLCHGALSVFIRPQFAQIAIAPRVLSIFHSNLYTYYSFTYLFFNIYTGCVHISKDAIFKIA